MSLSDLETAIATGLKAAPFVRDAMPADYPAIRGVVIAGLVPRAPCWPPSSGWRERPGHRCSRSTRPAL